MKKDLACQAVAPEERRKGHAAAVPVASPESVTRSMWNENSISCAVGGAVLGAVCGMPFGAVDVILGGIAGMAFGATLWCTISVIVISNRGRR